MDDDDAMLIFLFVGGLVGHGLSFLGWMNASALLSALWGVGCCVFFF